MEEFQPCSKLDTNCLNCTTCNNSTYLMSGRCMASCPYGYTPESLGRTCQPCSSVSTDANCQIEYLTAALTTSRTNINEIVISFSYLLTSIIDPKILKSNILFTIAALSPSDYDIENLKMTDLSTIIENLVYREQQFHQFSLEITFLNQSIFQSINSRGQ